MRVAFTLDDLPQWPMSYPPDPYTTDGIVDAIIEALDRNKIQGVYAFTNSWSLPKHPVHSDIIDRWTAAGHHVANHTHNHRSLDEVSVEEYCDEIAQAERYLGPWLSRAPVRYFRHPLCAWGNSQAKRTRVRSYLEDLGYQTAEVTNWVYEWRWNRAYINCLSKADQAGLVFCKQTFLEYSIAQLRYDCAFADEWFHHDVLGITLGHTVPFFADIAGEFFFGSRPRG
jgi:peptidoglycan-N-acetylglucosamine deacetylase